MRGTRADSEPSEGEQNETPLAETEDELIRRVQAGEQQPFRTLVERYKDLVFAVIIRQVGERDVAEELSQETFIKAYRHIGRFRFEAKFSTWLTRIALNNASSYFASKRFRQGRRTEEFNPETHDTGVDGPQQEMEKQELMRTFQQALATLKPKFQEVLSMCALEGKSYEEAAEILEIPVGTVRSRLNKARLLLKAAFQRQASEGGRS